MTIAAHGKKDSVLVGIAKGFGQILASLLVLVLIEDLVRYLLR